MRKLFALIVASVCAILGILSLVDGIQFLMQLGSATESEKTSLLIVGISLVAFFVISIGCLVATFSACFKFKRVGHAANYAVLSLAFFVLSQAFACLAQYISLKSASGVPQYQVTINYIVSIVIFIDAICLFIASINHFPFRKLFGFIGTIVGIICLALTCIGFANYNVVTKIILITGIATFILGFILIRAIPKKDKNRD